MTLPSLARPQRRPQARLEATFRIETPMFLGGANKDNTAELRLPSLKGVLRWWWRALAWSRYGGDLQRIREREFELFGAAADAQGRGVGRFSLAWTPGEPLPAQTQKASFPPGLGYLAGQGLCNMKGEWSRHALNPGQTFSITLIFNAKATEDDRTEIVEALTVMGLLGGLGARSRRGMGSLRLLSLKRDDHELLTSNFGSAAGMNTMLEPVLKRARTMTQEPPYSAFWSGTRVVVVEGKNADPTKVLEELGKEMVRFRAWGRGTPNGHQTVLREPAEQNFKDDHDDVQKAGQRGTIQRPPRRVAFGLPHNYRFSSVTPALNVDVSTTSRQQDRRASPLLLHTHSTQGAHAVGVLTLMQAQFLPNGLQIEVGRERDNRFRYTVRPDFWKPIHDYLARFLQPNTRPRAAAPLDLHPATEIAPIQPQERR